MKIEMMGMDSKFHEMSESDFKDMMSGDFYGACCECPIRIDGVEKTADEWQKTTNYGLIS